MRLCRDDGLDKKKATDGNGYRTRYTQDLELSKLRTKSLRGTSPRIISFQETNLNKSYLGSTPPAEPAHMQFSMHFAALAIPHPSLCSKPNGSRGVKFLCADFGGGSIAVLLGQISSGRFRAQFGFKNQAEIGQLG